MRQMAFVVKIPDVSRSPSVHIAVHIKSRPPPSNGHQYSRINITMMAVKADLSSSHLAEAMRMKKMIVLRVREVINSGTMYGILYRNKGFSQHTQRKIAANIVFALEITIKTRNVSVLSNRKLVCFQFPKTIRVTVRKTRQSHYCIEERQVFTTESVLYSSFTERKSVERISSSNAVRHEGS